jgi:NAD(P)-dependent dehydrogenase (short-subunit alcohol dehydrogenase family)
MNKVWLITGAARGFGALIAKAALARGDAVAATARPRERSNASAASTCS